MPLLCDQASVRNLLLWTREANVLEANVISEILLRGEAVYDEDRLGESRALLFASFRGVRCRDDVAESRAEHLSLRLQFRVSGKRVARTGATTACFAAGDSFAAIRRDVFGAPRRSV
jgi:hypothetical protein